MIDSEFISFVSDKTGFKRKELVEKDILLHSILFELVKNKQFNRDYAFKGGTCLIKCYLGYFRFSEDIDFSYLHQREFKGKSEKQIRRLLADKIDLLLELFMEISEKFDFDFKKDKNNPKYIEFGGSNKFVTFKIWYNSAVFNKESFIKIQINFVEKFLYPIAEMPISSLIGMNLAKEIGFLFKEYLYLLEPIRIKAYDLNEIVAEKIRAILTRKGVKLRDFIDVFLIVNKKKIDLYSFRNIIIKKTEFMLKYEKYYQNLQTKDKEIGNAMLNNEENLLLKPLPKDFEKFLEDFKPFLYKLIVELKKEKIKR